MRLGRRRGGTDDDELLEPQTGEFVHQSQGQFRTITDAVPLAMPRTVGRELDDGRLGGQRQAQRPCQEAGERRPLGPGQVDQIGRPCGAIGMPILEDGASGRRQHGGHQVTPGIDIVNGDQDFVETPGWPKLSESTSM